ncbi:MAG TPA: hypothetical protein VJ032_11355, partial [Thermoanaerobaculia bacterium]|nr:hypothetical protein [Thermoanaerobaculia bacterium]
ASKGQLMNTFRSYSSVSINYRDFLRAMTAAIAASILSRPIVLGSVGRRRSGNPCPLTILSGFVSSYGFFHFPAAFFDVLAVFFAIDLISTSPQRSAAHSHSSPRP